MEKFVVKKSHLIEEWKKNRMDVLEKHNVPAIDFNKFLGGKFDGDGS
jgi:hypothetical protein